MKCSKSVKNAHKGHNKEATTKLSLREFVAWSLGSMGSSMLTDHGEIRSTILRHWMSNKRPPKARR
jgi:hypothetical protein